MTTGKIRPEVVLPIYAKINKWNDYKFYAASRTGAFPWEEPCLPFAEVSATNAVTACFNLRVEAVFPMLPAISLTLRTTLVGDSSSVLARDVLSEANKLFKLSRPDEVASSALVRVLIMSYVSFRLLRQGVYMNFFSNHPKLCLLLNRKSAIGIRKSFPIPPCTLEYSFITSSHHVG